MRRYALGCGAAATILALGSIALATLLDPTFSWTGDALSDLGVRDRSTPVFNGGLILGGVVGLGYAAGLWNGTTANEPTETEPTERGLLHRVTAVTFGLSMVGMAGVGFFDLTHSLHAPAAIGFYLLATVVFAIDGIVRRETASGRITLSFVPIHVAVWWTWIAGYWPGPGLALPELAGAILLAFWVWVVGPLPVGKALQRTT